MNVQFVLHSLNSTPHTISNGNTQEVMSVQSLVHTKVKYPYFTDHNIGLQNAMCSSHTSHNISVATHNASVHKATYFYTQAYSEQEINLLRQNKITRAVLIYT